MPDNPYATPVAETTAKRRVSRKTWVAVSMLAGVLMLYPLSEGPVFQLVCENVVSLRTYETVYEPMNKIAELHPALERARVWYIRLFRNFGE